MKSPNRLSFTSWREALCLFFLAVCCHWPVYAQTDWPNVGNDKGAMRYSTLKQINRDNVKNLKVAWTYHTGDTDAEKKTPIQCTPIVAGGVMYLTTAKSKVVALDAATGREIWKYDPYADYAPAKIYHAGSGVNRGVAFWQGTDRIFDNQEMETSSPAF